MTPLQEVLAELPAAWWVWCGLLGMTVGSFLNVVCLRLPRMMERQWHQECCELLEIETPPLAESEAVFNLAFPPSHCPKCGHMIRAWENIPVISYLLLRGKCAGCQASISIRYPVVEALSGLLSTVVAMHFGFSWACAAALLFTWGLLALAIIDFDTHLLPDAITQLILWSGLLLALAPLFIPLEDALLGAVGGYLVLWSVYQVFRLLTGKEGMGFGDFKLLAAIGAWVGWQALPLVILASSAAGALVGLCLILFRGHNRQAPIPFGPYLAVAGWGVLLWGEPLSQAYLDLL